ncbi:MAG TPA: plastocyanin/azurin family copper-binding protein [Nitrospiria bacterium]|nr:plastocyanin/azurin family copper-binding protein [Nitrospiria bacterium]
MSRLSAWGIALVLVGAFMPVGSVRAADSAVHQVTIERDSFAFAPQALAIHQGDRVRWTNNDGQMHMVVTSKPDSNGRELELYKKIDPGATLEYQFNTAAAYYYYCAIHFQMWGIISVNP